VNHKLVFERISDVVVKTIIAAEPFMLDLNAKSILAFYSNKSI
jgi:hypothetical protein